ncbi:hypothetical protein NC797_11475 [Aquibacillus sp. 3ASR75-11]|uniref:Uncharacterized protein n=1 Tax=Terrihalobacillus insolitus TaxID=2950438 RepID=A0A9X4AMB8_9BACI|nr:hypothetical protein [Terrihalobacillus insolitus]MDC3425126.1 hypothetical protein [Terrihalobacillus insolitus]
MRTITLERINQNITNNRKQANAIIRTSALANGRRKKSRTRTPGEVKALNEISVARWQKAVKAGKIIRTGKRSMYYDYS